MPRAPSTAGSVVEPAVEPAMLSVAPLPMVMFPVNELFPVAF